jgi:glycosyltransferase involved in cell wall biosynthesis
MKILQVNKFHYNYGGSNRYYLNLSRILELDGHEVAYFSMKGDKNVPSPYSEYFIEPIDYDQIGGPIEMIRSFVNVLYSFEAKKKIGKLLNHFKPDLAHIHNIYHQISPSILPELKGFGIPVVMTAHDYKLVCPNYSLFDGREICERCEGGKRAYHASIGRCHQGTVAKGILLTLESYLHQLLGSYSKGLDLIIAPSQFMKDTLARFGIPEKKVVYVPNFVDPIPEKFEYEEGDHLLYFGRLAAEKGIEILLLAMKNFRDVPLLLAGEGPDKGRFEEITREEGLDNVRFVGKANRSEVESLIRRSKFTILPSIWYENCPLSILESMAYGKPVIGARIGGIPDLIEHDQDGLLFTAGDVDDLSRQIERLLAVRNRLREMGESGHRKVRGLYSKEVHYRSILSIYRRFLDG